MLSGRSSVFRRFAGMVKPKRLGHLVKIAGIGDHGVSLGVKLFDPEGNEIEVFY